MRFSAALTAMVGAIFIGATMANSPSPAGPSPSGPGPSPSSLEERSEAAAAPGPSTANHVFGPGTELFSPSSDHPLVVRSDASTPSPAGPGPEIAFFFGPKRNEISPGPDSPLEERSDASSPLPAGPASENPNPHPRLRSPGPKPSLEVRSETWDRKSDETTGPFGDGKKESKQETGAVNAEDLPLDEFESRQAKMKAEIKEEDRQALEFAKATNDKVTLEKFAEFWNLTAVERDDRNTARARERIAAQDVDYNKYKDESLAELLKFKEEGEIARAEKQAAKDRDVEKYVKQRKHKPATTPEPVPIAEKEAEKKAAADKIAEEKALAEKIAADKAAADKVKEEAKAKLTEEKVAADKLAEEKEAAKIEKQKVDEKLEADKLAAEEAKKAAADKLAAEKVATKQQEKDDGATVKAEEKTTKKQESDADKLAGHFNPMKHAVMRVAKPKSCSCFEAFSHILGYETKTSGPLDKFRLDFWAVRNRHCIEYCTHPFSKSEIDKYRVAMEGKLVVPENFPDHFHLEASASSGEHEKRGEMAAADHTPASTSTQLNILRDDIVKLWRIQNEAAKNATIAQKAQNEAVAKVASAQQASHKKLSPNTATATGPKSSNAELNAAYSLWLVELKSSIKKHRASIPKGDHEALKQLEAQYVEVVKAAEKNFIKANEEAAATVAVEMRKEVFRDLNMVKALEAIKAAKKLVASRKKKPVKIVKIVEGDATPVPAPVKPAKVVEILEGPASEAPVKPVKPVKIVEIVDGVASKAPVHNQNPNTGAPPA